MRNVTSGNNGNDHNARISLISCSHARTSRLIALRLMGFLAMVGMAVVPSVSVGGSLLCQELALRFLGDLFGLAMLATMQAASLMGEG